MEMPSTRERTKPSAGVRVILWNRSSGSEERITTRPRSPRAERIAFGSRASRTATRIISPVDNLRVIVSAGGSCSWNAHPPSGHVNTRRRCSFTCSASASSRCPRSIAPMASSTSPIRPPPVSTAALARVSTARSIIPRLSMISPKCACATDDSQWTMSPFTNITL